MSFSLSKVLRNNFVSTARRTMSTIRARSIVYTEYGDPQKVLKAHSFDLPGPDSLKGNAVLVKTLAAPLNPSDINQIQGVYPSRPPISMFSLPGLHDPSAVCGNEGVFEVLGTGPDVSGLQKGDWCIPSKVNFGTWATHSIAPDFEFLKVPNEIPLTQAATMAVNTSSAYLMLTKFAKLGKGDWFIQNGGNSQVGRCAIQIARELGYKSISIVRERSEAAALKLNGELTALGADHVITDKENASKAFGKVVKEWTKGNPIMLGLNCVGGPNVSGMARKLGKNATLVTYGGMSMKPVMLPTSLFIFKNLHAVGFWITRMTQDDPTLREKVIKKVLAMIQKGVFADIHCTLNKISVEEVTDDQFLQMFKQGLTDSSSKGKQIMTFK